MNKLAAFFFTAAVTAAFVGGCVSNKPAPPPKVVPDPCIPADREPEARAAAEKLALGMAEALKSGDFKKFDAVQPRIGRGLPEAVFAKRRAALTRMYGKLVAAEYFGCLGQGQVNDYLWKFTFESRKDGEKTSRRAIIFWVRVGFSGGKPMVAGFSFDLH